MPELEFYPEAREDLKGLDEAVQQAIFERLDRLEREGLSIPEVDYWEDNRGRGIFRLKVKQDTGEEVDHRVFLDIEEGKAVIYGIFHTGMWRMKNRSRKKSVKESGSESLGPGKRYV